MSVEKLNTRQRDRDVIAALFSSLTELEVLGRNTLPLPLGDGHAAQYDEAWFANVLPRLIEFEELASQITDRQAEEQYIDAFARLFNQSMVRNDQVIWPYKTQSNASRSIDNVMTLAGRRGWRCLMISPVFDNLYLYGTERRVNITPLPERELRAYGADAIDTKSYGLIFLVTPNNPTGYTLESQTLRDIARKCARERATLAIDASFRGYDESGADHYKILAEEGTSFIVIEDTGKLFPTRERKVSVISCSNDLKRDLHEIVEIDVLGPATPVVILCTYFLKEFQDLGLENAVRGRVRRARRAIRNELAGTILRPARVSINSTLPVEFIEIMDDRFNDLDVVQRLQQRGLGTLAGRFFWQTQADREANNRYIRLSLLKEERLFASAMEVLRGSLMEDFNDRP